MLFVDCVLLDDVVGGVSLQDGFEPFARCGFPLLDQSLLDGPVPLAVAGDVDDALDCRHVPSNF